MRVTALRTALAGISHPVLDSVILVDHPVPRCMRGATLGALSAAISSRPPGRAGVIVVVFLIVEREAGELADDGATFCLDKFQRVCVA